MKNADMAELADALASGASLRKKVKVQVLLSAPLPFCEIQFYRMYADMAELADALASGASPRKGVKVQVLLSAPLVFALLEAFLGKLSGFYKSLTTFLFFLLFLWNCAIISQ